MTIARADREIGAPARSVGQLGVETPRPPPGSSHPNQIDRMVNHGSARSWLVVEVVCSDGAVKNGLPDLCSRSANKGVVVHSMNFQRINLKVVTLP